MELNFFLFVCRYSFCRSLCVCVCVCVRTHLHTHGCMLVCACVWSCECLWCVRKTMFCFTFLVLCIHFADNVKYGVLTLVSETLQYRNDCCYYKLIFNIYSVSDTSFQWWSSSSTTMASLLAWTLRFGMLFPQGTEPWRKLPMCMHAHVCVCNCVGECVCMHVYVGVSFLLVLSCWNFGNYSFVITQCKLFWSMNFYSISMVTYHIGTIFTMKKMLME